MSTSATQRFVGYSQSQRSSAGVIARWYRQSLRRRKSLIYVMSHISYNQRARMQTLLETEHFLHNVFWFRNNITLLQTGKTAQQQSDKDVKILSVRTIEWLCTNFSRAEGNILLKDKAGQPFDLHAEYSTHLSTLGKAFFDPFRRGKNDIFTVHTADGLESWQCTTAQLSFALWAHQKNVFEYARQYHSIIRDSIRLAYRKRKQRVDRGDVKRKALCHRCTNTTSVIKGGKVKFMHESEDESSDGED